MIPIKDKISNLIDATKTWKKIKPYIRDLYRNVIYDFVIKQIYFKMQLHIINSIHHRLRPKFLQEINFIFRNKTAWQRKL